MSVTDVLFAEHHQLRIRDRHDLAVVVAARVDHASADADLRPHRAHDCPALVEDELRVGNCVDYGDLAGEIARTEIDREVWGNRECAASRSARNPSDPVSAV
jgi:hypothetical protein